MHNGIKRVSVRSFAFTPFVGTAAVVVIILVTVRRFPHTHSQPCTILVLSSCLPGWCSSYQPVVRSPSHSKVCMLSTDWSVACACCCGSYQPCSAPPPPSLRCVSSLSTGWWPVPAAAVPMNTAVWPFPLSLSYVCSLHLVIDCLCLLLQLLLTLWCGPTSWVLSHCWSQNRWAQQ